MFNREKFVEEFCNVDRKYNGDISAHKLKFRLQNIFNKADSLILKELFIFALQEPKDLTIFSLIVLYTIKDIVGEESWNNSIKLINDNAGNFLLQIND